MKVTCERSALDEALNLAGAVVVTRTPKPVLSCVKMTALEGLMTLNSTDLEVALHIQVGQVEVVEDGEALIPADKILGIVRESGDATLTIETEKDATHVRGEGSHYKIFGYPSGDFPSIAQFTDEPDFMINAGQLHDLITKTLFATARENSRYAINGVLLEREGKKITLVATDGRRLAMARGSVEQPVGDPQSAIVPTKALSMLARLFVDGDELVKVKIVHGQAMFATELATLTTNLVEGNFPPYHDVIPKEQDKKAVFDTDILASGVRRAALLINEETKGVKLSFGKEALLLSSRNPEMGESEINVPIVEYSGELIDIGFNPAFLTDVLKVVGSDQVTMEMKAPNKPGVLKVGNDLTYVVMPVNLD